jgi:hypothetical protein
MRVAARNFTPFRLSPVYLPLTDATAAVPYVSSDVRLIRKPKPEAPSAANEVIGLQEATMASDHRKQNSNLLI